jgi:hypothetical protein
VSDLLSEPLPSGTEHMNNALNSHVYIEAGHTYPDDPNTYTNPYDTTSTGSRTSYIDPLTNLEYSSSSSSSSHHQSERTSVRGHRHGSTRQVVPMRAQPQPQPMPMRMSMSDVNDTRRESCSIM